VKGTNEKAQGKPCMLLIAGHFVHNRVLTVHITTLKEITKEVSVSYLVLICFILPKSCVLSPELPFTQPLNNITWMLKMFD
jgi:hypothetical protein